MSVEERLCVVERDVMELQQQRFQDLQRQEEDRGRMDRFEAVLGRLEKRQIRFEEVQNGHSAALVNLQQLAAEGIQRADDHSARLGRVETDVAELKNDMKTVKADVAGLKTDVAGLKTDVAGLKTDVAGLKTGMNELTGMVQQLLDRAS